MDKYGKPNEKTPSKWEAELYESSKAGKVKIGNFKFLISYKIRFTILRFSI